MSLSKRMHWNSLIVQWLGLHFNLPRARGWIPGWGTETPLAAQPKKQQQQGMYIGRIWIKSRRMEGIWLGDEDILVPEIKMIQNKQTKNNPRRRAGGSKGKRSECDVEGAHRAPPIVPLYGFCAFAGMLNHPLLGRRVNQSQKEKFCFC